jgi:MFS family permease
MLRTPQFYMLWWVFMSSALAGLMVIYCIKLFGLDVLTHHGVAGAGAVASTAMAWYAIFNGVGRIAWGSVSDRLGRKGAIMLMTAAQGVVMLTLYHVFIAYGAATGFIVAAAVIGFNFGGNFALFPAATADLFGNAKVGSNYGWVFTAYGVAGIAGPQLAGYFKDAASATDGPSIWMTPFILAGAACLLGTAVMAAVRPAAVRAVAPEDRVPAGLPALAPAPAAARGE